MVLVFLILVLVNSEKFSRHFLGFCVFSSSLRVLILLQLLDLGLELSSVFLASRLFDDLMPQVLLSR